MGLPWSITAGRLSHWYVFLLETEKLSSSDFFSQVLVLSQRLVVSVAALMPATGQQSQTTCAALGRKRSFRKLPDYRQNEESSSS
jgi:hypothetical protein